MSVLTVASNDPARHVHVVVSSKLIKYCNHEQRRKDVLLIKVKITVTAVKLFRFAYFISYFFCECNM